MRVLVAPDSFKGTFTAVQVAGALAAGLEHAGATVDRCPVADGGEGTLEVLLGPLGGREETSPALDPLGRLIEARYGVFGRTAIIEMATVSGLGLLTEEERNPWIATTYGTGQLINAAAEGGARHIIVGVGGSATVDGGRGALKAMSRHGFFKDVKFTVLCDVRTTWERCAAVYGPQKGADPATVVRLAARLRSFARRLPKDPRGIECAGAAGEPAGALWATVDAGLEPGAPYVLNILNFDDRLEVVDAVVCGEGRIDAQTAEGKIVGEVARRAHAAGVPVHAVVGRNELDDSTAGTIGLTSIREATTLAEIEAAGAELGSVLAPA